MTLNLLFRTRLPYASVFTLALAAPPARHFPGNTKTPHK